LKEKILVISIMVALTMLVFMPASSALPLIGVYGYTDKPQYLPGETVTVKVYIYNYGPEEIVLKNVTIIYPWYNIIWGGNETIANINQPLTKGAYWETTRTFTIPNDGRASGDSIDVTYAYAIGASVYTPARPAEIRFELTSVPLDQSLKDLDKLINLFTIQTLLLIIGALIIAASIFLSTRRPKVTWKAEEKE